MAAHTAHRDRMKKLHDLLQRLPASAKNQTVNANYAEKKLRQAQAILEKPDGIAYAEMMGQMGSGLAVADDGGLRGGNAGNAGANARHGHDGRRRDVGHDGARRADGRRRHGRNDDGASGQAKRRRR